MAEGFPDPFEPVEYLDGGENVGGIGALAAFALDQPLLREEAPYLFEQSLFRSARDEPGAKVAEYRGVKAGIGQLQGQRIFPINACAHGIGSRAVSQALRKLYDGDIAILNWL